MKKNIFLAFTVLFSVYALAASPVFAGGECVNQYGQTYECEPTDLTINKQVQDPISGVYVENVTTAKFSQGDTVIFRLLVKNASGADRSDVKVKDWVPENLVIDDVDAQAPGNKWVTVAGDKKSFEVKIEKMGVNQEITIYLWTHLVGPYPSEDQFCRDNWADVTSPDRPNGDKNFARFCVANKVASATALPKAGVEDLAMIIPFALSGLGGLALLRKKS